MVNSRLIGIHRGQFKSGLIDFFFVDFNGGLDDGNGLLMD